MVAMNSYEHPSGYRVAFHELGELGVAFRSARDTLQPTIA